MRSCDIINLHIADIEWRSKCITIIQHKTGNPLTIPLLPVVGNAISEYLLEERPDCEYNHVFVRTVAPFCPLVDHSSVYEIIRKVFVVAGASETACGTRKLRHNAASKMLKAGCTLPVIAASLGHAAPDTTNIYLTTDDEVLKECILPLPKGVQQ
jgi:integrase